MISTRLTRTRDAVLSPPIITGLIAVMFSVAVLVGWVNNVELLRTVALGQVSMKANAASAFAVCGLLLILANAKPRPILTLIRWPLELVVFAIGLLTLSQYVFGLNFGIDYALVAGRPGDILTSSPDRMSPTTAIGFVLLAAAFMLDHGYARWGAIAGRSLAVIVLLIALTSVIGYAYGQPTLYLGIRGVTAMALSTAIVFGFLAIGFIWLHPKSGIPALLSESSLVNSHVRALLIVIVSAPLLVGALVQFGYGRFYEGELAIALTSLGSVVVAATVALVSIVVLHHTENALFVKDRVLAAATNGVVITDHLDPNESIIFVNDAFAEITGFDRDYCMGRNCRFLNRGLDNPPHAMRELRRLIASGDRGSVEIRNRRKDGTIFWNRLSLAPIANQDGTVTHLIGIIDDITASRDQGERLQRALDEARISNAMRDAFIQVITHELRTPLNAALTWLRLMEIDDSVETRTKGLSVMAHSIDSQSRLIDDLVDVTRIATEGITLESVPIDARDLIETTIDELRPDIQEKQELIVHIEPGDYQAELDSVRIQQVLRNLLSNASKYTPPGGRIKVTLTREKASLCLSVSDNGKGLSTEEIGHVFDPFWRANTNVAGLGVGLSIVAALVKAHAGTITVTSDGPDSGCTFTVRIPVDSAPSGRFSIRHQSGAESTST